MGLRNVLAKIKAHHASPHDFDAFRWDDSVRGKGTGDQAYGEGVYLAESPKEMESYYDFFKERNPPEEALWDVIYDIQRNNSRGRTPADITRIQEQLRASHDPVVRALADNPDALPSLQTVINDTGMAGSSDPAGVSRALQRLKGHMPKPTAHRYDVEVDARKSDLLGWHDRLSEQSDDVRGTMSDLLKPDLERMQTVREQMLQKGGQGVPGSRFFKPLTDLQRVQYSNPPDPTGETMYNLLRKRENAVEPTQTSGQYASDTLRDAGVPGSFHDDSTTTASNLVIFKPEIINIIKKYGVPGALGAGLISQADADAYAASMPQATKNGTRLFGKESLWETPSHRSGPSRDELRDMLSEAAQPPSTARQTAPSDALLKKAQTYNAGFTGEKKYDPGDYDAGKGEMFWDALQSAGTAARNVTESTIGTIGDWTKSSHELAQSIADYGKSKGSSIDQTGSVAAMSKSPLTQSTMPTSEDVHGAAESILDRTVSPDWRKFISDWSEHEATTPWGSASGATVDTLFDPMNALGAPGKAAKVAKKAARFFR